MCRRESCSHFGLAWQMAFNTVQNMFSMFHAPPGASANAYAPPPILILQSSKIIFEPSPNVKRN